MKCRHRNKILVGMGIAFLMLISNSAFVSALPIPMIFSGYVYISGTNATNGTFIKVEQANTGEQFANYTTNSTHPNRYTFTITVLDDANLTNDSYAYCGDPLKFTVKPPSWLAAVIAETPRSGSIKANCTPDSRIVDINTSYCVDGVKNRDELMTDCGGLYCTPCYSLNASPTNETEILTKTNTSETFNLIIYNTGYHNLTNVNFNVSTCNFTVNVTPNEISQINGSGCGDCNSCDCSWSYVTAIVNKTIGDLPYGTYYCNLTINSDNASSVVRIAVNTPRICNCSNCTECNTKLNDTNCSSVTLNSDILNHSGTCIIIPRNNVTLNCNRHSISGSSTGYGIFVKYNSTTIQDCNISLFSQGIRANYSQNSAFINNVISNSSSDGIYAHYSNYNNILRNTLYSNNQTGVTLYSSHFNLLSGNTIYNNTNYGIHLTYSSKNNSIISNTIVNNSNNGLDFNSTSVNNSVSGNTICYNVNYDIRNLATITENFGSGNFCNKTLSWNETGATVTNCTYYCGQSFAESFTISLSQGWNLISIPLNLSSK